MQQELLGIRESNFEVLSVLNQRLYGSYSTDPNKRTYLNKHTYLNFFQKAITVPTQITVPTRKSLYLLSTNATKMS